MSLTITNYTNSLSIPFTLSNEPNAIPLTLRVTSPDQLSECDIHLFGACITSWRTRDTHSDAWQRHLFCSEKAVLDGSKPIRGGIPIVFPQFGQGPMMAGQHGFARRSLWSLEQFSVHNDSTQISLILKDSAATRLEWNFAFEIKLIVTLPSGGHSMLVQFQVKNPAKDAAFQMTPLLHTYLFVDVPKLTVQGLENAVFDEQVYSIKDGTQQDKLLHITKEVDRTYRQVKQVEVLQSNKRTIRVQSVQGFEDMVIWNPWESKASKLTDFKTEEYLTMLCCEPGHVVTPVSVLPGSTWQGEMLLSRL